MDKIQTQPLPHVETYLGDGLYASFDGFQIILRAPRSGGDRWVALEPKVMENLIEFVERIYGVKIEIVKLEKVYESP